MSINQLVYSIATIFAIASVCTAKPITDAPNGERYDASQMVIGLVALICVSVLIFSCAKSQFWHVCCHRNKSGFEEFENENTIVDQMNSSSRSEFPIFRAISPANVGQFNSNNAENHLDNRILSNIVNQNDMSHNEFENNQNNNGPISVVDMENIQNNNAMDYIANRNEINIVVEPSPHTINRNLLEISDNMNATASTTVEQFVPTPIAIECENVACNSDFDYQLNEFDECHIDQTLPYFSKAATASESLNNYIDLDEDNDGYINHAFHEKSSSEINIEIDGEMSKSISDRNIVINQQDSNNDDAINIEEALRALDFAISGGEAIHLDYQDTYSSDESENDSETNEVRPIAVEEKYQPLQNELEEDQRSTSSIKFEVNECTSIELIENAKDRIKLNEAEKLVENTCCNTIANIEHSREYLSEVAKELVDSVLQECTERISLMTHHPHGACNENIIVVQIDECSNANISTNPNADANANADADADADADTIVKMEKTQLNDSDDSMDETFVIGKLEASTPCHKNFATRQDANIQHRMNLFQTLDEVNESALSTDDGVMPLQTTYTQLACTTFEIQPEKNQLASTFVKNDDDHLIDNDKTFVKSDDQTFIAASDSVPQNKLNGDGNEVKLQNVMPRIKIDKEETNSDDLTTITPMNTPIELNYVGESWDQFISKSMSKKMQEKDNELIENATTPVPNMSNSKNSWFLHPSQPNDTFDVNNTDYSNYEGMDEDMESDEENQELLSLTFDTLRKQLADVLPQASVRPSLEYSDDEEENASNSDTDCDSLECNTRFENLKSEVIINYKQQLSPILEESEDETIKTFVINETKCLDSTSTGCIETSEAIMGVTKILMASNDTLFNFEDTLGDRDDMMLSPRNAANSENSITPQPDSCKTPTNESYLNAYSVEYKPNDAYSDNQQMTETKPNSLQLNFENLTNNLSIGDLLSPEQQKTFSEEINTIEQLSSDLSATIDATNTLDDLKTCISVHLNDDTNNSKLGNSEDECIDQQYQAKVNGIVECSGTIDLIEKSIGCTKAHGTSHTTTSPKDHDVDESKQVSKLTLDSGTVLELIEANESLKENKNPNLDLNNVTKLEKKCNLNKASELSQTDAEHESRSKTEPENTEDFPEPAAELSGEEDPWVAHSMADIRFSGPCVDDEEISGTFATNDWDSDIEDSNSSEEFLYTKGVSQIGDYLRSTQNTSYSSDSRKQIDLEYADSIAEPSKQHEIDDGALNPQEIWNTHDDLVAVATNGK